MYYKFSGHFFAENGPNYTEPLVNVKVRLSRYHGTKYVTALSVADPAERMKVLKEDEYNAVVHSQIAICETDSNGEFLFEIPADEYEGQAFDLSLIIEQISGLERPKERPVQEIYLTTMRPNWTLVEDTESKMVASWSYTLPATIWQNIRRSFDAWLVCGRILTHDSEMTVPDVQVTAYDADRFQDDLLGKALTDADGRFRIEYRSKDFMQTPLSPLYNAEADNGPDLYFTVEKTDGTPLLIEESERGNNKNRQNAGACFYIELAVPDTKVDVVKVGEELVEA